MTTSDKSTLLSADELHGINAYWRACTYLAAGMIYLRDNPTLLPSMNSKLSRQRPIKRAADAFRRSRIAAISFPFNLSNHV
jgi:phosphoketolase